MVSTSSLVRALGADSAESDAALLARFAGAREEAAFTALFDRHGPMVRAVCRRCCRDPHLAADAEQGVWLVLARKAAAVSRPDRLAAWLFGVALRVGRKAAATARATPATDSRAVPDATVAVMADELLRVLDEELSALPEAERLPLVLCYLEGRTQDEAARVCGASVRTLRRRLDRGRESLRRRLERRGVAPAAALAGLAVAPVAAARPAVLEAALQ
ncbi:sigma-70 family RNA polymerase sigma factor, partial [bacterium]|nr:sigma-70 family RNA polymerase sigma factor [bacterium]